MAILPQFLSKFVVNVISVVVISWATSFAAFESKLIVKKYDLKKRIDFIEKRWAYALGYGLPASLMYTFLPNAFSTGTWQYMQLLLTLRAHNVPSLVSVSLPRLRIFGIAQELAKFLINLVA